MNGDGVRVGASALVYGAERRPPVLGRLGQLAQVVMRAAHHPGVGISAEGRKRSFLRARHPLQAVRVGAGAH